MADDDNEIVLVNMPDGRVLPMTKAEAKAAAKPVKPVLIEQVYRTPAKTKTPAPKTNRPRQRTTKRK